MDIRASGVGDGATMFCKTLPSAVLDQDLCRSALQAGNTDSGFISKETHGS